MKPNNAVCNYAMLRFIPHPETGEVVNVGVLVNCLQPCFLHLLVEKSMPARVRGLFPNYNATVFAAAAEAINKEVKRISARVRDPKDCQRFFNELVRPRENTFRFGEVKTVLTDNPKNLSEELFQRYVCMEPITPQTLTA